MQEWLTFSLLDMTPYDRQSWLNLIATYNQALWPMHLLAGGFALLLPICLWFIKGTPRYQAYRGRLVLLILALGWIFCGAVFQREYAAHLNWAAGYFAILFVIQGLLLFLVALLLRQITWVDWVDNADAVNNGPLRRRTGFILIIIGLFVYPLTGFLEGRHLAQLEWFLLTPTPTTLTTIGFLMLLRHKARYGLIVLPLLWVVISAAFAFTLELLAFYFLSGAFLCWWGHCGLMTLQKQNK